MKLLLALGLFAAVLQGPVVNSPTPDVTTIRIPADLPDSVTICAEFKVDTACITVKDLRGYLKGRHFANEHE